MQRRTRLMMVVFVVLTAASAALAGETDVAGLLKSLQAVGPNGAGHQEAARAWAELARCDAHVVPAMLAALDQSNPLAANWIRTAIDTVVQRTLQQGQELPRGELEKFVLDAHHAPKARRLAYELLARADASAPERLMPRMLNDPSLELRRDAVARQIEAAEAVQTSLRESEALAIFQKAFTAARDPDQVQLLAGRLAKLGAKADVLRHFGFLVCWHVIGPFDNVDDKGYDSAYPPEQQIDLKQAYAGKYGEVRWVEHETTSPEGLVDLNKLLGETKGVAAYALAEFIAAQQRPAQIRISSDNAVQLRLNGQLVDEHHVYHSGVQFDQYVSNVQLQRGRNVILLKVCQNELTEEWGRAWSFRLRVCDAIGTAILPAEGP